MLKAITSSIIILLVLLSCRKPATGNAPDPYVPGTGTSGNTNTVITRTYLALGDSYTIGQSVEVNERFPVQVVSMLGNLGVQFKQPEIIAQTGWTTGNLLFRLDNTAPLQAKYDIVTLLIGVNNQYQARSREEYRQQFTTLLEKAIQFAGNNKLHVFVLSIPDYSVTPFAAGRDRDLIAREIDSFNIINKTISQQYQVSYIDITGDSRQAAVYPSLTANDGLHPSGEQYKMWASKLAPVIKVLFQ